MKHLQVNIKYIIFFSKSCDQQPTSENSERANEYFK